MLELNKIHNCDALEAMKDMPDNSVDVTITDPPYNMGMNYGQKADGTKYCDEKSDYQYEFWCRQWFKELERITKKWIVFTPGTANLHMWHMIRKPDWIVIWYRANAMTGTPYGGINAWEPILVYVKDANKQKPKINYDVMRFNVAMQDGVGDHPCPKQLDFWTELVTMFTSEGDLVCDIFSGSGTTPIVCKLLNRNFIAFEINPSFVELANKRLNQKSILNWG